MCFQRFTSSRAISKNDVGKPFSAEKLSVNASIDHLLVNPYNIKHVFTNNKFISFDLNYLYYKDTNPTNYKNSFFDENYDFLNEELTRSRKLTPIKTWVGKFDYSNQINDKVKFETGIKGAFSTFDNDVSVENYISNNWVIDPTLTSHSYLVENIYAAYLGLDYTINEKRSSKFGLRYDYTDSQLDTDTEGIVVYKQYGKIFPTVFLNRKFNDDLNMNFSYTKRITRPTFNEMAPFVILWDPNTFTSGNVEIQPGFSNSIKYDINYKSTIFSLQYTHEDSSIARFQVTYDDVNDRVILRSENLDYVKTFSGTVGLPVKIANWWRTQNNFIYTNQKIRTPESADETINLSIDNFTVNSTNSFKFSDSFLGEITALYTGPNYNGTSRSKEFYRIDIGLQKKFSNKWGSLRFAINDVFDSFKFNRITDIPSQNLTIVSNFKFSHRTFSLTYSRNFGNAKLKSQRKRQTGSEEERRRAN